MFDTEFIKLFYVINLLYMYEDERCSVMSLSVNNGQYIQQPAFKGKFARTEQGNTYYKTNAGTVAGGVMAGVAALPWLNRLSFKEVPPLDIDSKAFMKESGMEDVFKAFGVKDLDDALNKANKSGIRMKKYAIPFALIAAACTLGCGMLVDNIRNKKAKETADYTAQVGVHNALMNGDSVALSNKGRTYYDSNVGKKYGALLGAGCGLIESIMSAGKFKPIGLLNMIPMAIGGLIMGAITDHCTNNSAKKNA